mgnify:CR=1 FL=1
MNRLFVLCALTLTMIGCGGGGGGGSKSSTPTTSKASSLAASSKAASSTVGGVSSSSAISASSQSSVPSGAANTDPLAISNEGAVDGKVAIDDQGNAIAIWHELNTNAFASHSLWMNRYVKGTGWGKAQLLESDAGNVSESNLYIDSASGRAVVIWEQFTSASQDDLWVRRFDPATGWSAADRIENLDTTLGIFPQAIIDGAGNVLAVWAQMDKPYGTFSIWSNRYTAVAGWGTAATIENNNVVGGMDGSPSLASLGNGNAVAVWVTSGDGVHISTNVYSSSTGWGTASQLVTDSGTDMSLNFPKVVADGAGKALLAWGQWDFVNSASVSNVFVKNYNNGWSQQAINVGSHQGSDLISNPSVTSNNNGVAAVTWGRKDQAVMANVRASNGSWGQASVIKAANADSVLSVPQVGIDGAANAMLVWPHQSNDRSSKDSWFSTFTIAGGNWSAGQLLEPYKGTAIEPRIAVNSNGDRVVIWYNITDFSNIGSQIYARYFPAGTAAKP